MYLRPKISLTAFLAVLAVFVVSQTASIPVAQAAELKVDFTKEFIENPENIAIGKKIWVKQCAKCHGASAYPGKAPKLKPSKYKIEFVYKRVTKGFRGMPSWKKKYDKNERMAVSAYVKSHDFAD